jgi:HlyD family secretion protein
MNTIPMPRRPSTPLVENGSAVTLRFQAVNPHRSPGIRALTWQGIAIVLLCLVGFFAWATLTELSSAVLANATIALQSRRQAIQHLEGGIIAQVFVREGETVAAGQPLFRLDDAQAKANASILRGQLDASLAFEARLLAERDGAAEVSFPASLTERSGDPVTQTLMRDQEIQFRDRRAAYQGQIAVLDSEATQLRSEVEGLKREERSANEQRQLIERELVGVTELVEKGLSTLQRQLSLARERARLDGLVGRNQSDETKALTSIEEVRLQIIQLGQKRQEEVAAGLQEVRSRIADQGDRLSAAMDVLRRLDIAAPCDGVVQNVRNATVGAVIRPGDLMMEIVPIHDELLVEAQVGPADIDRLYPGMQSEIRFPAFHARNTPVIQGKVRSLSRDRLIDEATHAPYYLAQVAVNDTDLPADLSARLRAGMPAEVIFPTGERSVLRYLVKPLADAFVTTFREQ